jgi:hypothetical protein
MKITTETGQKPAWRVSFNVDPVWLRRLQRIAVSFIFLYGALLTLPFTFTLPGTGLDSSHMFGSNYYPNMGYKYGLDLVFTYGPLGYLVNPEPVANNVAIANLIRGVVWLILFAHLIRIYRLGKRGVWQSLVLLASLVIIRNQLFYSFDYFILATLLVVVIYLIERGEGWLSYSCMVFLAGLASLTKFTGYLLSIPAVALLVVARVGWPPKLPPWKERFVPVAILLAAPVAFFSLIPSVTAFWRYMRGSLEVSSGYSAAMSYPTSPQDLSYMLILMGLFSAGLVYALARRTLLWSSALVLVFLYWLNLKHGFVRSDGHVVFSYAFEIVLAACLICLLKGRREIVSYSIVLPCFVLVALSGINPYWPVWNEGYWTPAPQLHLAHALLDWSGTRPWLDSELKKHDSFTQLPDDFQRSLEGSVTTVFPWELSYATSRHFRVDPLYFMQAYSGYTQYLDNMGARRIRERYGRVDHILFDWQSIDERHPLLDVPATWQAMFDCYRPALVGANRLLLVRRDKPIEHQATFLTRVPLPFRTWVELPRSKSVLWSRMLIPYSVRGQARNFLYKMPPVWLTVGLESGAKLRFRVIPSVLSTSFPLNDMPVDFDSLVALWQSQRVSSPVARIRLDSEEPAGYRESSMELFEETQSTVEFVRPSEHDGLHR